MITPETLGFTYWLRADGLAATLDSWVPRFGVGTLGQADPARQFVKNAADPAYNNKPSITLQAGDDMFVAATYGVPLPPFSVLFVGDTSAASTYWFSQLSAVGGKYGQCPGVSLRYEETTTDISGAITVANPGTYGFTVAADRTVKFYQNGGQVGADQTHAAFTASGAAGTFRVGGLPGVGFTGTMTDFCAANTVIPAARMLALHTGYVVPRYAI